MCLIIDFYRQPTLKPLVAKNDILVHKLLQRDRNGEYFTFYMRHPVVFSKGVAILEACLGKPKRVSIQGYLGYIINEGIHSLRTNRRHYVTKKAIIPKGTRFYIGRLNDIVSEKLIIFE